MHPYGHMEELLYFLKSVERKHVTMANNHLVWGKEVQWHAQPSQCASSGLTAVSLPSALEEINSSHNVQFIGRLYPAAAQMVCDIYIKKIIICKLPRIQNQWRKMR